MECSVKDNTERCTCSYPGCSRKGKCCECLKYHLENRELPGCCFPAAAESSYDRSFEHFIRINGQDGL
ncbi:MAG: DUF6485 family protein [archaeon]